MRVTQKMWANSLLGSINQSYERMSAIDLRRRITKASDDPAGAEQMLRLRALLQHNEQYQDNAASASRWLDYSDQALASAGEAMREVRELALTAADDGSDLSGIVPSLDRLFDRFLDLANSEQGGRYLFAGSRGEIKPFSQMGGQVVYHGDDHELSAAISGALSLRYNTPGSEIFGESSAWLESHLDWDPEVNDATDLSALFDGRGLSLGRVRITDGAGATAVVDLSGSATLGDVRARLAGALPTISVDILDGERLEIRDSSGGASPLRIEDVQGGMSAAVLGLAGSGSGALISRDLDPALTEATPLTELRGITLPLGAIGIELGEVTEPAVVDLSGALTVGDLRDAIQAAVPELTVGIADGGNRLRIDTAPGLSFTISDLEGDDTAGLLGLSGTGVPCRPFGVLLDLKEAVDQGDREWVRQLLAEVEAVEERFLEVRAQVGTRWRLAEDAEATLDARNYTLTETLSEVGDADMVEAMLMYQNAENIYQASLALAANIYQLTLANYL